MQIAYNIDNFAVLEFYKYPTAVIHRINEYDEGFNEGSSSCSDDDVKELFEMLLEVTEKALGRKLMDNKIAMKVKYLPTDTILYIGYKDWNWSIGLGLNPYQTGKAWELG